ncbi:segregation/condensation protein A [Streptomyces sp. WAC 04229]|uniref:segregation and condensation protein A n=1 Tax=Streptomyces sp. WAC 04229 TaxID=2203206 RepID=UPI000FFFFC81|nr:segregation/condensation protein A [Streptomyces sp. WAC 04229]RSN61672.1 segregation/condensation protein A [Streptomyces sp. WAC 04229]
MTSNDASSSGPRAGRRRALGREPGEASGPPAGSEEEAQPRAAPAPVAVEPPPEPLPEAAPSEVPPESAPVEALLAAPAAPADASLPQGPETGSSPRTAPGEADAAEPAPERLPEAAPSEVPPESAPVEASAPAPADGDADGVFKVRLANFEGPFDLLLQLISKHKMDVTEVALSKVTDEFMAHIRAMGSDWDLDETTEFLVVAATLLDLKAARLLPAAEVEDEADLALLEARDLLFARLLQYRAYKQIAEIFNERLESEARRYPRTVGLEPHHAELLPEVVISIGPEGFAKLGVKAMQPKPRPQVYVEHIHAPLVSVQEQAQIVVARLRELGEASFRVLVQDTADTLTVVARFLALLELYREKAVELDQETALGDLLVRWTGGDEDAAPVVTDEFDRPPEKTEEERKA